MGEPIRKITITRRAFLKSGAGVTVLAAAGAAAGLGLRHAAKAGDTVWQIDPDKCVQCGRCATACVLAPSAVKCVHAYDVCGYCNRCGGFHQPEAKVTDTAAENQLCPTAAIRRTFVEDPYYRYDIVEALCIGCGKCVKGCGAFGNGSLFLQIRHDRCVNCNQCAIAQTCPAQAISRVPAAHPYKLRGTQEGAGMSRPDSRGLGRSMRIVAAVVLLALTAGGLWAAPPPARFPQPEFEGGYVQPLTSVPAPRALALEYADVGVLAAALALASWLALRRRSRGGLVALALFTVGYFGFFRRGCVCPVGAIQNVAAVLADPAQAIPWTVAAFFLLPLVFAALFGRVFCASVCPLGVLQELVLWKPTRVPAWLSAPLGMVPVLYLGTAVLLAATGADYIICHSDPFVGFYRLGGPLPMLLAGGLLLALGLFVGRPYCRFLCPYGVLLGWISRFAFRHATITPDGCINCRLCEQACPYDCIRAPEPEPSPEPHAKTRRRLVLVLALIPLLTLAGAGLGAMLQGPLARKHATVRLADRITFESRNPEAAYTVESEAFRATGRPPAELVVEAGRLRRAFRIGSILLGAFVGLVLGVRLAGLACPPKLACHDMDRATCVSCARCFASCSVERAARTAAARPAEPAEPPGGAHAG